MTTGNFWNVTNPAKPFGLFDPDGVYDIPFDWSDWLAGLSDTYGSHMIICETGVECTSSAQAAGVITARIDKDPAETLVASAKYGITCRITTTNGQVEDQTVYLKVVEK